MTVGIIKLHWLKWDYLLTVGCGTHYLGLWTVPGKWRRRESCPVPCAHPWVPDCVCDIASGFKLLLSWLPPWCTAPLSCEPGFPLRLTLSRCFVIQQGQEGRQNRKSKATKTKVSLTGASLTLHQALLLSPCHSEETELRWVEPCPGPSRDLCDTGNKDYLGATP